MTSETRPSALMRRIKVNKPRLRAPHIHWLGPRDPVTRKRLYKCRPFMFLHLPAEIRNQIYDYLFEPTLVQILGRIDHIPKGSPLYLLHRGPTPPEAIPAEANIILTCSHIHDEAIIFLYSRVTFEFSQMKALDYFFNNDHTLFFEKRRKRISVRASPNHEKNEQWPIEGHLPHTPPPPARCAIKSLSIIHYTAGEPASYSNRKLKLKHDDKWASLLDKIHDTLPCLSSLKIQLIIHDHPVHMCALTDPWARPITDAFGRSLETCTIELRYSGAITTSRVISPKDDSRLHEQMVKAAGVDLQFLCLKPEHVMRKMGTLTRKAAVRIRKVLKRREEIELQIAMQNSVLHD